MIGALLEKLIFDHRRQVLWLLGIVTIGFAVQAGRLAIDAGFEKQLPLRHPYMETFLEHREQFGGANRLLITVRARDGDLFDPASLERVRLVTRALGEVPGVNRTSITSIFTPNVSFVRIVEGGFQGGNVVPAEWS
ncbi:MAG TPA: RND family transporter, partial [Planctomycetes bacterium]|nr:RND family transporter [Planctomycetota bacterium]